MLGLSNFSLLTSNFLMTKLVKFALVLTTVFFAVVLYLLMDGTLKTGYEIAQGIGILEHIVAFIVFATISYNVLHLKKPINPVFGCILLVLMVVSVGWSINAFTTDLNALYGFNENGEKYGQAERREKERQEREQQRQEQQQQRQEAKQRYLEEKYADVDDRIAADSNDVSVIVEKGDLLRYDVRWSEAVKEYEKALSLDSVNFGALFGLWRGILRYQRL